MNAAGDSGMKVIYLDHNATTAVDPAVLDEMLPWLSGRYANPSSIHSFGQAARRALDTARTRVAGLIGARREEVIFTSGGTEANNLAILGAVDAARRTRPHVVATAIEHQAVLKPCRRVEETGGAAVFLPVDSEGVLDPEAVAPALSEDTLLVSVMLANNEVGTVQPVAAISRVTRARGVLVHTDAVQAAGRIPVDVAALGVDLLSISGHKVYGPQGVGALYIRRGTRLSARIFGGHQEREIRPGTENIAAIAGFGKACELAGDRLAADAAHLASLRATFEAALLDRLTGIEVNAAGAVRLPNTSNVSFDGVDGEALAISLDLQGVAVSTGSACSSVGGGPSHVLAAMGRSRTQALTAIRFSYGRENTAEEVERAVALVVRTVETMRENKR